MAKKKLTSAKAKKILHDKSVHGHPLTDKQRKFFGAIANAQMGTMVTPLDFSKSLGTLEGVSDVMSAPARTATYLVTGKYQDPSEAIGIKNPVGAFVTDMVLDPVNLIGAGLAGKAAKASTKTGMLRNAYKINPWAFKPSPEAYYHRSPNLENIINQEKGLIQGWGASEAGKLYNEASRIRPSFNINLKKGADSEIYFSKGTPLDWGRTNMILDEKTGKLISGQGYPGPYIVEVENVPFVAKANRKFTKVLDEKTGEFVRGELPPTTKGSYAVPKRPISVDEAKFYKEDWLRGYKEIKPPKKKQDGGWLDKYEQGGMVLKQKKQDNYGTKPNANNSDVNLPPNFKGLAYNTKGRNYSPAWGGQFQMGGVLPGAVGFTYARTQGAAPSNGPYAKKTKASAQNGMEMKYYQEGLDFKPKTISQDGTKIPLLPIDRRAVSENTRVVVPQRDMRTEAEALRDEYLANPTVVKSSNKFIDIEERNRRNRAYAQKYGRTYDEATGTVGSVFSPSAERTMNRAAENIVLPALDIEMGMGAAKLVGAGAKAAGKYLTKESKKLVKPTSITSSADDANRNLDLEELRRVYHNSERFLQLEEARFLHKHGHGLRENYRTQNSIWNRQNNLTDNELNRLSDIVQNNNQLLAPPSEIQFMPDGTTRTIYQQQPITDYVSGSYRPDYSSINPNFITSVTPSLRSSRITSTDLQRLNDIINDELDNLFTFNTNAKTSSKPNVINRSGLTKEEAIAKASSKDKDAISKMTEQQFKETVLKPTGEIVQYKPGTSLEQMTYDVNARRMVLKDQVPMTDEAYAKTFNEKIDLLNDIIAKNNKSGVQYKVKELTPDGRLKFETPEQTIKQNIENPNYQYLQNLKAHNERLLKEIDDLKNTPLNERAVPNEDVIVEYFNKREIEENNQIIDKLKNEPEFILSDVNVPKGESTWSVRLNPGKWKGNVEDIPNTEYLRSIPGLEMSNTLSGVFADSKPRRGTGAYESINEYLKKLDLGRVKPGFNSQTNFSRGAWENFIKSGRGVGFYANPKTVYGTMKSVFPYVGIGGAGALGASALQEKKQNGGDIPVDPDGYWNPDNWGNPVIIPSTDITMEGVYQPLIGISDTGDIQYMEPGEDYEFDGEYVTEYPVAQAGKNIPTTADSLRVYNAALATMNYYKNDRRHIAPSIDEYTGPITRANVDQVGIENLNMYRKMFKDISDPTFSERLYKVLYGNDYGISKNELLRRIALAIKEAKSAPSGISYYKDAFPSKIDINAPSAVVDARIQPQGFTFFSSSVPRDTNNLPTGPEPAGTVTGVYYYDPLAVKPYHMRTPEEKEKWEKKYGKPKPKPKPNPKPNPKLKPIPTPVVQKKEQSKSLVPVPPAEPKYKMRGDSPIYGPSGSLIGMIDRKTKEFYPDYLNEAARAKVNKTDTDILSDSSALSNYFKSIGQNDVRIVPKKKSGGNINQLDEYPIEKLDNLLNFTNYNKATKGGWLDKYQ